MEGAGANIGGYVIGNNVTMRGLTFLQNANATPANVKMRGYQSGTFNGQPILTLEFGNSASTVNSAFQLENTSDLSSVNATAIANGSAGRITLNGTFTGSLGNASGTTASRPNQAYGLYFSGVGTGGFLLQNDASAVTAGYTASQTFWGVNSTGGVIVDSNNAFGAGNAQNVRIGVQRGAAPATEFQVISQTSLLLRGDRAISAPISIGVVDNNAGYGTVILGSDNIATNNVATFSGNVTRRIQATAEDTARLLQLRSDGSGRVDFTGSFTDGTTNRTVTGVGTFAQALTHVEKIGSGVVRLTGNNNLRGNWRVTDGTLVFNGTLAAAPLNPDLARTTPVSVAVGTPGALTTGRLAGTGTLNRITNINSNGVLTPGDPAGASSKGTLIFGDNLTLAGSTLLELFSGTADDSDKVSVAAAKTLGFGGSLTVAQVGSWTFAADQSWDLFDFSLKSGTFGSNLNLPTLPSDLEWDTSALESSGVISVVTLVPEPTSVAMLALGAVGALRRRRAA
jgi:autotransporter-associated beta strand protein